jgi:hypothetical protein
MLIVIEKLCLPAGRTLSLPGTARTRRREMMGNHAGTRNNWRRNRWRKGEDIRSRAISTDIVLVSSELAALSSDALKILLGWSICEANLEKETFFTNRLTMEFADDLVADLATLKASAVS